MARKARSLLEPLPPLEVIAQQLCAIARLPHVFDHQKNHVAFDVPDAAAFVDAIKALRLERCDKAKLDEALVLKRTIEEEKQRLDQLLEEIPRELLRD